MLNMVYDQSAENSDKPLSMILLLFVSVKIKIDLKTNSVILFEFSPVFLLAQSTLKY
jgi:hypothetical protein